MEQEQLLKTNFFTTEEWDSTPQGVKNFVVQQKQRIEELEKQLENLQEKVNCNSKNSSIPPSTEIVKPFSKKPRKERKEKEADKRGILVTVENYTQNPNVKVPKITYQKPVNVVGKNSQVQMKILTDTK